MYSSIYYHNLANYVYPFVADHVKNKAIEKYERNQAIKKLKENKVIENYAAQLKNKYRGYSKLFSEQQWPPISTKFTKLGYVIHRPKRTARETEEFARLASSGYQSFTSESTHVHSCDDFVVGLDQNFNSFDLNVTIREEISDLSITTGVHK